MKYILFLFLLLQVSCAKHSIKDYKSETPKLDLQKFFSGDLYALGIVQDRSGKVIQRFKVDMNGSWKKNVGTLDEQFDYSDGTKSERIWTLTKKENQEFEGEAADVEGTAYGKVSGNAFFFEYVLNLPVDGTVYEVKFDDWMYLLDNNTLMARTYMTKWGFAVGEVTIVMMKR